jgi:hypothetical protein
MARIAPVLLGSAALVAVVALGVAGKAPAALTAFRAAVAAVLGWIVGKLVFGRPGLLGDAESAGAVPPSAPPEVRGGGEGPGSKPS